MNCSDCGVNACYYDKSLPKNCPTEEINRETLDSRYDEETKKIAQAAAIVEAEGYCQWTRIEEIMAFANKCDYKALGIAFCIGLRREVKALTKVFETNGFTVKAIMCKYGSVPKELLGLSEEQKVHPGNFEAMCNPIGQADFLNKAKTDLNLILGLCVGHDTIFMKHSEAPVTVVAVKDRVLGHNPLAAIYLAEGYYKNKLNKNTQEGKVRDL